MDFTWYAVRAIFADANHGYCTTEFWTNDESKAVERAFNLYRSNVKIAETRAIGVRVDQVSLGDDGVTIVGQYEHLVIGVSFMIDKIADPRPRLRV